MVEDDAIDGYLCVVLGDDFLTRHVQHGFFHVHLAVGALPQRHDKVKTRLQRAVVTPQTQHGALRTLIDDLNGTQPEPEREGNQYDDENRAAAEGKGERWGHEYAP